MSGLAQRECVPCRGGVPPLDDAQIAPLLAQLDDGWRVAERDDSKRGKVKILERSYRFDNFAQAMQAAARIGEIAEEQQHHPDLAISWGRLSVEIWTHKIGGLTESDFIFAAKCDAAGFGPGACGYPQSIVQFSRERPFMQIDTTLLPARGNDAVEILINDHQVIKSLLRELTEATGPGREQVLEQLKGVLTIHNATEENIVYPAINKVAGSKLEAQHLYHETAEADTLLFELDSMLKQRDESDFGEKATKFAEAVRHHIEEEEQKALPRLQENADQRDRQLIAESVKTFRKSLHFELASG